MIIKLIPENDFEKQSMKEVEHRGVKSFFIFGNKKDEDNDPVDFHDWNGSYRYLQGSLYYFLNVVTEESNAKRDVQSSLKKSETFHPFVKTGKVEDPNISIVEVTKEEDDAPKTEVINFPSQEAILKSESAEDNT